MNPLWLRVEILRCLGWRWPERVFSGLDFGLGRMHRFPGRRERQLWRPIWSFHFETVTFSLFWWNENFARLVWFVSSSASRHWFRSGLVSVKHWFYIECLDSQVKQIRHRNINLGSDWSGQQKPLKLSEIKQKDNNVQFSDFCVKKTVVTLTLTCTLYTGHL